MRAELLNPGRPTIMQTAPHAIHGAQEEIPQVIESNRNRSVASAKPKIGELEPLKGSGLLFLSLLALINVVNFIDRQLPFILVSAIKADLQLSDTQIGLMAGLSFALVYSIAGLPLARLADRRSPRLVLTLSLAFWSVMTAASGLVQSFLQLILARTAVAAGEAGSTPAAHALISKLYLPKRRALGLAIFSLGVPLGSTLGLVLGGWINDLTNWRVAFFIVGLPGLVLSAIAWVFLPKLPKGPTGQAHRPYPKELRLLLGLRSYVHMASASSLFACGSYAMNVFAPAFLMRVHGLSTTKAGLVIGLAFGIGGGAGTFAGGYFADRLGRKDPRWGQWIPMAGQLIAIPAALGTWLVDDTLTCGLLLGLTYFAGLLYFAPTFATAQNLVPDNLRATASAVLLFCLTLVGSSMGPLVVGAASDALAPQYGAASLRYAMSLMVLTIAWSALHFHLAAKALPGDLSRAQAEADSVC